MFRLEIFVDDKKLSYVLWALSGHVLEMKPPQPVANAQVRNGKVHAKVPSGNRVEMLMQHLRDKKITRMYGPGEVQKFCSNVGLSEKSYSVILRSALDTRLLKRRRKLKSESGGSKADWVYEVQKGA